MENSKIEWCHHTFNPWIGCQEVSPGCNNCYAARQNRFRKWTADGDWGPHAERRRTSEAYWKQPFSWAKAARESGTRPRVFCASLADVFDNKAPEGARDDLFRLIRATPELDWLLLTKRPQNIVKMLPADWDDGYPNVWLGITAEDQEHYLMRWPILSRIPAVVRFVSYEPAIAPLGSVDIGNAVRA
jgi:protein gp37